MDNPLFSVIIPVYNRPDFLRHAIQSVLAQSFSDFELIVVDDGSFEPAAASLRDMTDSRLRLFFQPNSGVSSARNNGIRNSRGEYLAFLDSDDSFEPEKLAVSAEFIRQYPEFLVFHTEEIWYKNGKFLNQKAIHRKPEGDIFENSLRLCCVSPSTVVIRRDLFAQVGLFDESLPACEDYDFWLRVSCCQPIKLIPKVLTIKQGGHADQLSRQPCLDRYRIKAIVKILESGRLNQKQKIAAQKELCRKCDIYICGAKKRKNFKEAEHYGKLIEQYNTSLEND